jgi:hypothetical protein
MGVNDAYNVIKRYCTKNWRTVIFHTHQLTSKSLYFFEMFVIQIPFPVHL